MGEHLWIRDTDIRLSLLFELERLFGVPLTQLDLLEVYADCSLIRPDGDYVKEQKAAVEGEAQRYRETVQRSRFGKPVIEADFQERREREARL